MRVASGGLLAALVVLHVLGVAGLIGHRALAHEQPVVDVDLGMHFYRAALLRETGGFPGLVWDPGYMGGYPLGGATNVDNRLGELGVVALGFLAVGAAWNWTLFLLFSAVPLIVFVAARWSGLTAPAATLSAFLAALLFWKMTLGDHMFVSLGLYGWAMACAAIPLMFGAFQRVLVEPGARSAVFLGLSTAFAGYAHGLSANYLPLLAAILAGRVRGLKRAHFITIVGGAVIAGLLVWPIFRPVVETVADSSWDLGLARYFQATPQEVAKLLASPYRMLGHTLLLLCIAGLTSRTFDRPIKELALSVLAVTFVSLFVFLILPPSGLQPTRNVEAAFFLATIPASQLLTQVGAGLWRLRLPARLVVASFALAIVAPTLVIWGLNILGQRGFTTEPSPEARRLVEYLRHNTEPASRILVEDDGDGFGGNHFGKPHLVGYLAREIRRELIGGPHPITFSRVASATFVNGELFGNPVSEFDDAELRAALRAYNVGTVVTWSERSRARFAALGLTATELDGGFAVFRTGLATGFAVGAYSVAARAEPNVIRVWGATESPTVLRWQFDPRFRTEPPLPMRSVEAPFSPVGFIQVENGTVSEFSVLFED